MKSKNKLTSKQIDELIYTLKSYFEKHKLRHKGIAWESVEKKSNLIQKKNRPFTKWKEQVASLMLYTMIKKQMSLFSWIVRQKVQRNEEVFVTTMKHWKLENNTNQKIVL